MSAVVAMVLRSASAGATALQLAATLSVERTEAARQCADSAELQDRIERILQRPMGPPAAGADTIQIAVIFDRQHDEFVAQLRFLGPKPGERTLRDRGATCSSLEYAVTVAIALTLDGEMEAAESASPQNSPHDISHPTAVQLEKKSVDHTGVTPRSANYPILLTFESGPTWGLADRASASFSTQLGLLAPSGWYVELAASALLPASTRFGNGSVDVSLISGIVRGCYQLGERLSIGPCLGFAAGRLHGEGRGFTQTTSENLRWAALGPALLAQGPLWGRWYWGTSAAIGFPLLRPTFSVENLGVAWHSPAVSSAISFRLGVRLW